MSLVLSSGTCNPCLSGSISVLLECTYSLVPLGYQVEGALVASKMEEASERMWQLVSDSAVARLHEMNEATTRLLVIDRVLNILGWTNEDFNPEELVPGEGFTDYLLQVDGQSRLVVEAKKAGR